MYHLYILECADKTLYTGITTDLKRRIVEHNSAKLGAKYTLHRRPVKLAYSKKFRNRSIASKEEARIKNLKKSENFTRNEKGQSRYAKGNQIGHMKKKGFTLTDLNKLIRKYEKDNGEPLLKHYIEQLFKDNRLLEKYIDKNVPTINELTGAGGGPVEIFEIIKTYEQPKQNEQPKNQYTTDPKTD